MGIWRYVVSRSRGDWPEVNKWEIRELYPAEDGTYGYTENPIAPFGESFDDLVRDLEHMRTDADLELLDLTTDPPQLVPRTELEQE